MIILWQFKWSMDIFSWLKSLIISLLIISSVTLATNYWKKMLVLVCQVLYILLFSMTANASKY